MIKKLRFSPLEKNVLNLVEGLIIEAGPFQCDTKSSLETDGLLFILKSETEEKKEVYNFERYKTENEMAQRIWR